jgi:hypothetical protein
MIMRYIYLGKTDSLAFVRKIYYYLSKEWGFGILLHLW